MDTRTVRTVLLGLVVSGAFLYLAFRNIELAQLLEALGRLRPGLLVAAIGISLLIMVFRAWRWQLELRPLERIPLGRLWVVTAVSYMCINLFPARLGEVVRPWLLSKRSRVSFSNVVGNLVVEKTMDSVVTLFYTLAGLVLVESLPIWVRRFAMVPAAVAIIMVSLAVLLYWRGEQFVDRVVLRLLPARFAAPVKRVAAAIVAGMQVLPNPRLLLAVFLVSLALWFLPILSSYVLIRAFDFQVPFSAAVVVFIFIGIGTALPGAPGMIGIYQFACQKALEIFGVPPADGLAYGLVLNAIQFLTLIAQGLVALPLAGVTWSDLRRASRDDAEQDGGLRVED